MNKLLSGRKKYRVRGFSLLELMVVLVLLGGIMTMTVLSVGTLSGSKIKDEVTRIAGIASETYALAAISGVTHRINFDLDENTYWVDARQKEAGVIAPDLGYDELLVTLRARNKEWEKEKNNAFVPIYKPVKGALGEKYKMPGGLSLYGAWTEQMSSVERTGRVSIYFFAGGYTQTSFVSVAEKDDEEDSAMYVALSPLTASVSINYGEPDTKSLLDNEGEK